jgi:hypothetical protein
MSEVMEKRYITQQQVKLYMKYRQKEKLTQAASAAKVGISARSGYTIEHGRHYTQQPKQPRSYKTRTSPIDQIWTEELQPMLEENPDLQPSTLFIYLNRKYQDEQGNPLYAPSVLRTLQRRVAQWQGEHGKPKDVIFPQNHIPGQQGLSDFTSMNDLEISIAGHLFKHMLYHFRLVYSKWSYVKVIQGGESFQALSEGLQEALIHLGGSPKEHRTDSLSAAYRNLTQEAKTDATQSYQALCAHYSMTPTRNNKGVSHENGSVESSHGHLKNRIQQELILRNSHDFSSIPIYEKWIQDIVLTSNKRNSRHFPIEKAELQALPRHKTIDYELILTKVSGLSMIVIRNMTYSVPSRLVGHTLTIHLYQDRIEGYLGSSQVFNMQRGQFKISRYVIDYRHIIHAFIKKPRAFRYCKYRDHVLPSQSYREIWHYLDAKESREVAPKLILRLLKLAADYDCEFELGEHVLGLVKKQLPIDIERIERDFNGSNPRLPDVPCIQHSLNHYDGLLTTGGLCDATL